MTYVVTDKCIGVKSLDCVDICPVEAFHEGPDMLYINPDSCINCHNCVDACPANAIYKASDLPAKYHRFLEINREESLKHPVCD